MENKNIKEKVKEIEEKPVKERQEWEHHFLIRFKYAGSVRNYFLSMGKFKDVEIEEDKTQSTQYKCGHSGKPIILNDNILSITAWMEWSESVGVFGDKTECWECWCRKEDNGVKNEN